MTNPVTIGNATLYLGDCLEILPTLDKVDAVVTDPPYGISDAPMLAGSRGGARRGGDGDYFPAAEWDRAFPAEALRKCCDVSPVVLWFGHWRKRTMAETAARWPIRCEIIWAKNCHTGPPCPVAMQDERIWIFSERGLVRPFEISVWSEAVIPTWKRKEHRNEKPERLMNRAVRWITDGAVIDPFMGSGTTGVAAMNLGRKFIGIEMEPKYFDIACERIEKRTETTKAVCVTNPVMVLLKEAAGTQAFQAPDYGIPEITPQDAGLASQGSGEKYYLAARLLHGDTSTDTIEKLQSHLWWSTCRIIQHDNWPIPKGGEVYRAFCDLAILEHLIPSIKTDEMRVLVYGRIIDARRPKNPIEITEYAWPRWKQRYTIIWKELNGWQESHLHHMANRLN